jgi:hypothetical protein
MSFRRILCYHKRHSFDVYLNRQITKIQLSDSNPLVVDGKAFRPTLFLFSTITPLPHPLFISGSRFSTHSRKRHNSLLPNNLRQIIQIPPKPMCVPFTLHLPIAHILDKMTRGSDLCSTRILVANLCAQKSYPKSRSLHGYFGPRDAYSLRTASGVKIVTDSWSKIASLLFFLVGPLTRQASQG